MKGHFLSDKCIEQFKLYLEREEKSDNTRQKYVRDVMAFSAFAKGEITKDTAIAFKQHLTENGYAVRSVNSMLASLNSLFCFLGWEDCKVKSLKVQRSAFCSEQKELTQAEYTRLCHAAEQKQNKRLSLILQTLCGTGIRVSELKFITVQAVQNGQATVSLKGKTRTVFIVRELQQKLKAYCKEKGIQTGSVFVTKSGKPMSRTNIWREMKDLCRKAKVNPEKVFPHNLRHLFARVFYGIEKDIAKLADILGHSSIDTTRIYIVSTGTEHRRRMEKCTSSFEKTLTNAIKKPLAGDYNIIDIML